MKPEGKEKGKGVREVMEEGDRAGKEIERREGEKKKWEK